MKTEVSSVISLVLMLSMSGCSSMQPSVVAIDSSKSIVDSLREVVAKDAFLKQNLREDTTYLGLSYNVPYSTSDTSTKPRTAVQRLRMLSDKWCVDNGGVMVVQKFLPLIRDGVLAGLDNSSGNDPYICVRGADALGAASFNNSGFVYVINGDVLGAAREMQAKLVGNRERTLAKLANNTADEQSAHSYTRRLQHHPHLGDKVSVSGCAAFSRYGCVSENKVGRGNGVITAFRKDKIQVTTDFGVVLWVTAIDLYAPM